MLQCTGTGRLNIAASQQAKCAFVLRAAHLDVVIINLCHSNRTRRPNQNNKTVCCLLLGPSHPIPHLYTISHRRHTGRYDYS